MKEEDMITCQESSETTFKDFNKLSKNLKDKLLERECQNCNQDLKDYAKVDYVILENEEVRWWHHRDFRTGWVCNALLI